jgi:hypothetical protein
MHIVQFKVSKPDYRRTNVLKITERISARPYKSQALVEVALALLDRFPVSRVGGALKVPIVPGLLQPVDNESKLIKD